MSIVLFAIIGATINADAAYWICFGVYSACRVLQIIGSIIKDLN